MAVVNQRFAGSSPQITSLNYHQHTELGLETEAASVSAAHLNILLPREHQEAHHNFLQPAVVYGSSSEAASCILSYNS